VVYFVKRKIAFGNSLGFQTKIDDLPSKYRILGENCKNNIIARSPRFARESFALHPNITLVRRLIYTKGH
jgi:hypothetical protein